MIDKIKAFYETKALEARLTGMSDLEAVELITGLTSLLYDTRIAVDFNWVMSLCDTFNSCKEYMGDNVCYTGAPHTTPMFRTCCIADGIYAKTGIRLFDKIAGWALKVSLA